MSYEYLFCATCGIRRMGHGMRCTVCDSLLRRAAPHSSRASVLSLPPIVRAEIPSTVPVRQPAPERERQPVAA